MSATYPLILFCTTAALWWFTVWYSHHLFHAFCNRFPVDAARELPYAFDRGFAHSENGTFLFRRRAAEIMDTDPKLRRMRKRFIALSVISLAFPLLWSIPLLIYAIINS